MSCAYFVSDIHLKSSKDANVSVLIQFLKQLLKDATGGSKEAPTSLFLVGDIFDLWIADHDFFIQEFKPVIEIIQQLQSAGVTIHFFEGNHDLHLQKFWERELGVQVHGEARYFELGSQVVRVEHGDQMNPHDSGYLFLRWLLRTPILRWLSYHLPAFVVKAIGERASGVSRQYTSTRKELPIDKIHALTRLHAETVFQQQAFDLMISGHVHVIDDYIFRASGRTIRSVNLGSWYDGPKAFVLNDDGGKFLKLEP